MPVTIKALPGGEFRGEQSATAEINKSQRSKMANKMTAEQMLSRIYNMTRGMVSPKFVAAEAGSKKKQAKRMGGKVAPKKMMHGGKVKKK